MKWVNAMICLRVIFNDYYQGCSDAWRMCSGRARKVVLKFVNDALKITHADLIQSQILLLHVDFTPSTLLLIATNRSKY